MLDVDVLILGFLADNPGANKSAVGRAIADHYSPQYANVRLDVMTARGMIRCEVTGSPPRYKFFTLPRSEEGIEA